MNQICVRSERPLLFDNVDILPKNSRRKKSISEMENANYSYAVGLVSESIFFLEHLTWLSTVSAVNKI